MPEDPVADLVAEARRGSEAAWRGLMGRFQERFLRLAWGLTGDRHLAEDVVQETFVEAFVRIGSLREGGAFGAWARTILVRTARRRRGQKVLPASARGHERTPAADLAGKELCEAVDAAIGSLRPIHREAIALAVDEELTSVEAAKLLGCSPVAFRVRLHEARRRLRGMLAPFLGE